MDYHSLTIWLSQSTPAVISSWLNVVDSVK